MTASIQRLHYPDGELPAGRKIRGVCHCGYTTTPRVDSTRALNALLEEHGWTSASDGCAICGWTAEDVHIGDLIAGQRMRSSPPYPIEVYRPLFDPDAGKEVWVCRDEAACHMRHRGHQQALDQAAHRAVDELFAAGRRSSASNVVPFRRNHRT